MASQYPLHAPVPLPGHHSGHDSAAYDTIADALVTQGWIAVRGFFSHEELRALEARLRALVAQERLTSAGVGRGSDNTADDTIRRDLTRWLERDDPAETHLLNRMETLRQELNRRLMLGLFFYEAHFALYERGGFYKKHLDSFRGRRNRLISTVLYLNEDWQPQDGGLLALYADEQATTPFTHILPERGTLVLFLSEEIPHAVLTAARSRQSIAGWFRCNDKNGAPALQAPTLPAV